MARVVRTVNEDNCIMEMSKVIQGEGRLMGKPFLLIRFWGCPYRCKFKDTICDTSYAWSKPDDTFSFAQAIEFINKNSDIDRVMLTGGEPTMRDGSEMCSFMWYLNRHKKYVLVETAGYNYPTWSEHVNEWSVSPKIGAIDASIINWDAMRSMAESSYRCSFKFVVDSAEKAKEVLTEYDSEINGGRDSVYLMPEGDSRDLLDKNRAEIIDFCSRYGVCYSDRLHIAAFGKDVAGK